MNVQNSYQKIKRELAELERIFDFSPDMVGAGNLRGYFTKINRQFREILGYEDKSFMSVPFLTFVHPEDLEKTQKALTAAANGLDELFIENRYKCKDGSYKWIEWKVMSILEEDRFYAVGRDISKRKKAELVNEALIEKLQKATEKIKTLQGIIPICASCKNIRDDKGYWNQIEAYIREHSHAEFTHSICPECAQKLYPDIFNK